MSKCNCDNCKCCQDNNTVPQTELDRILTKPRPDLTEAQQVAQLKADLQAEIDKELEKTRRDLWKHLKFVR